jgi:hypothetical protein
VFGVGGAGGNAVNNMIDARAGQGVDFVVANTDAQALTSSKAERIIQMGSCRSPKASAPARSRRSARRRRGGDRRDPRSSRNRARTWCSSPPAWAAAPAPARRRSSPRPRASMGILTVGVVTKPFHFEGQRRMRTPSRHRRAAEGGRHADRHPEPEPVPGRQREDHLRRRLRDGRPGALFGRRLHHRPDGQGRPDQSRLRRRPRRDARDGQGDDGHRRGLRREARADGRRGRDRQPADRRRPR